LSTPPRETCHADARRPLADCPDNHGFGQPRIMPAASHRGKEKRAMGQSAAVRVAAHS